MDIFVNVFLSKQNVCDTRKIDEKNINYLLMGLLCVVKYVVIWWCNFWIEYFWGQFVSKDREIYVVNKERKREEESRSERET